MKIRPAGAEDLPFLREMLYEAAFWNPEAERLPFDVAINRPELARYHEGWGREGDAGVVAVDDDGTRLGAAYWRLFTADDHGHGYIDDDTPEIAIGVVAEHRGRGIGRALLEALTDLGVRTGLRRIALSVEPTNHAKHLYASIGYVDFGSPDDGHHRMVLNLQPYPSLQPVDRHLDDDLVRKLVRSAFPEIDAATVTKAGEGWDNEVFLVDNTWMFRFPRRAEHVPWFEREITVMPVVAEALGPLVPRFEKIAPPTDDFPYPFVGYRPLAGVGADTIDLPEPDALARDIADAYTRLHAIDSSRIPPTPNHSEDDPWHALSPRDAEKVRGAAALLTSGTRARAEAFLRDEVDRPRPTTGRRVVHNDICAEHVLVDPDTGRLTGLIDWSDAMVGDPVADFVGLIHIGRWDFVRAVIASYDGEMDDAFLERLVWVTRVLTLRWLAEVLDTDEAPDKHVTWVERAFEDPA